MSENETVEELDTQVESEVATDDDNEQEANTASDDEITVEQALKWKKDSESLQKANKKIAMLEKGKKVEKSETTDSMPKTEAEYEVWAERRDFYKANSQAKDLKDEIEAMVTASKWRLDRSKAFEVLSGDSEIEENRKVYWKSTVESGKSNSVWFNPVSIDKYDSMSSAEQEAYNAKSKSVKGGVVFK